jgi:cyclophilin family peptidyl-prolyl cis-trans isomerase
MLSFHTSLNATVLLSGILGLANCGPDTNKSQFYICFVATPYLDKKSEVIGEVPPLRAFPLIRL